MDQAQNDFQVLHELFKAARARLDDNIWDYLIGGTETETTVKRNRLALDSVGFRPRVLRDVSAVDCSATFLGHKLSLPVALAPIGSLESFDPGAGAAAARGAARAGVVSFHSSVSQPSMEEIADAADNPKIFQLYVRGDDDWIGDYAKRAIASGYTAFCITVDTALYSRRERDIAKRFVKPWRREMSGLEYQAGLTWDNMKRFKDRHDIPLIVKGIATAEDAATACELGVDGVYVSNHGGRQLDHGRGALDVLPEVVDAVAGRAFVIVDGGFMRGSDVVKGIALGADLVGLGRLPIAGFAAAGEAGLTRAFELLAAEVHAALGLLGVTSFAELDKSYIHPAPPADRPHVLSAFPLLNIPDGDY